METETQAEGEPRRDDWQRRIDRRDESLTRLSSTVWTMIDGRREERIEAARVMLQELHSASTLVSDLAAEVRGLEARLRSSLWNIVMQLAREQVERGDAHTGTPTADGEATVSQVKQGEQADATRGDGDDQRAPADDTAGR